MVSVQVATNKVRPHLALIACIPDEFRNILPELFI